VSTPHGLAGAIRRWHARWHAALKYHLGKADPIYKWRISFSECPNCHGRLFLSLRPDPYLTRCVRCGASAVTLSLIPVIQNHRRQHTITCAWEMSTYGATLEFLKREISCVIESEFFPGRRSGELIDAVLNQDVQKLSFEDASIDLITSNQVFEHVADDSLGFSECFRVLRPGGALIFTVPLYGAPRTEILAEVVNHEIVHHREPEYHDSRTGGPRSALTYRRYSQMDVADGVSKVGFEVHLVDVTVAASQGFPVKVVYGVKN